MSVNKLDQKLDQISIVNMLKIFRRIVLILFVLCYVFIFFNMSYGFIFDIPEVSDYNIKSFHYSGFLFLFYVCLVLIEVTTEAVQEWLTDKVRRM